MQYNPEEFDEILNIFNSESEEIIQELNDNFMALEKDVNDKTPIKRLLQLSHSLKGSARMLGFNSIQNLAHKLEDILSYWSKENIKINKLAFTTIYETCDYLSKLINKCVQAKNNYEDERNNTQLNKLDEILSSNDDTNQAQKESNNINYLKTKNMDINAIVLELMLVIEKDDDDVLSVLTDNLKELESIFSKTNFLSIKNELALLIKNLSEENSEENKLEYLKENIPKLRNNIYNLLKTFNIKSSNKNNAKTKNQKQESVQKPEKQINPDDELIKKFDFAIENLKKTKYDISYADEITGFLQTINPQTEHEKNILQKTINILNLYKDKNIQLNNDCYLVILQCIYTLKRIYLKDENLNINNIDFLMQRLNVVEDMFNIMNNEKAQVTVNEEKNVIKPDSFSDLKKNLTGIDFQEIKTLRVDTYKLDNLISQTGELLINGIKTKNHLLELSKINTELIKFSGENKKILNYLKYLEKKGFFTQSADDNITAFYKKVQSFFSENSIIIHEVNKKVNNLYNTMFTDDNKLCQNTMEIDVLAKGIRVLPLATIFHLFPRMVRDIAQENNKQINFIVTGSDTTIDKKLMEEIKVPLIHLLRNAVSHGIELPEERIKKHKDAMGTIKLSAKQEENYVILTIEDDGFGIDIEKVKKISLQKGILTKEELENIDNEHLVKLLFLPGFSTSESIDEISGRGVGLDVVKTKIHNLNGEIFIDSAINQGCKVTIKLPLSMSTIKTFILLIGNQKYAMPINTIKYVKTINKNEIYKKDNQQCIIYNSHSIPIFSLSEILENNTQQKNNSDILTIVIIEIRGQEAAFMVDGLINDQEVFHKKLVAPIIKIKNISGFTTLSNGEICLILNPYELMKNYIQDKYINNVVTKLISTDKIE